MQNNFKLNILWPIGFLLWGVSCGKGGNAPVNTSQTPAPKTSSSSGPTSNTSPSSTVTVSIPSGATGMGTAAYGANPLIITPGTTVTWVNQDAMPHTATSSSGVWDSSTLPTGQTYSYQFKTEGTFPYICTIHGAASMSGTIQVSK